MIFCFSGTGNSLAVARMLSAQLDDGLYPVTGCMYGHTEWQEAWRQADIVCFVCPVYAWGVPRIVERFVVQTLAPAADRLPRQCHVYLVLTCGDDMGMADKRFRRLLLSKGLPLHAAFSVTMPNTYVGLPGFDVDAPHVRDAKLSAFPERVRHIADTMKEGTARAADVHRGVLPRLKTCLLRPLFNFFITSERRFSADSRCTACGLCAHGCPTGNIRPDAAGRPVWTGHCADCLRCYHLCPRHSIAYGKHSRSAGQYIHKGLLHGDNHVRQAVPLGKE